MTKQQKWQINYLWIISGNRGRDKQKRTEVLEKCNQKINSFGKFLATAPWYKIEGTENVQEILTKSRVV